MGTISKNHIVSSFLKEFWSYLLNNILKKMCIFLTNTSCGSILQRTAFAGLVDLKV